MRHLALLAGTMLVTLPQIVETVRPLPIPGAGPPSKVDLTYTTSSLGNTDPSPASSVPSNVKAMAVNRDGYVALQTDWEEGGKEASIVHDGRVLRTPGGHGWGAGYKTGVGVAINGELAFFAQSQGNDNNTLGARQPERKWPPFDLGTKTNYHDWGVYVLRLDGTPLEGGEGLDGAFFPLVRVAESIEGVKTGIGARIQSLAADESYLYAAVQGEIRKYEIAAIRAFASTNKVPAPALSWPAVGVTGMAVDPGDLDLWVIQNGVLNRYAAGGGTPVQQITFVSQPTAIAFNGLGHLLVGSAATNQVFEICLGPPPEIFSVMGASIFSGPVPGAAGGARFAGIVGVGSDRLGHIYVAENRSQLDARVSSFQGGIQEWSVQSIGSINIAEPDPWDGDAGSWYSVSNRMTFDPVTGAWREAAVTLNLKKYPHDPRIGATRAYVRKFTTPGSPPRILYTADFHGARLLIHRFNPATDGEVAIPCSAIVPTDHGSSDPVVKPIGLKPAGQYIWRDLDGDGDFDSGEFDSARAIAGDVWSTHVDDAGTVTVLYRLGPIRRFPLQGFDGNGCPIYRYSASSIDAPPKPFTSHSMGRAIYNSTDDTMIVTGFTSAHALNERLGEMWGQVGKVVVLYDRWTSARSPRYQLVLPFDASDPLQLPRAMAVAGDYMFFAQLKSAEVLVYQRSTGSYVGTMKPPPGATAGGWIDTQTGLSAFVRSSGRFIVSQEEEIGAKNLLYIQGQ